MEAAVALCADRDYGRDLVLVAAESDNPPPSARQRPARSGNSSRNYIVPAPAWLIAATSVRRPELPEEPSRVMGVDTQTPG